MSSARPELVIFDCDGVIVDSEPITDQVLAANLTRHGWRISVREVGGLFVGGTMAQIRDAALERGLDLPVDWIDRVYAELFVALEETPAVPGVAAVLDALDAAAIPYCIGSNGPQAKMDVTLRAAGFADRFEGRRFSAREVSAPKPAPDLFLFAAERMGVPAERCVVVGDTLNDAKAARAAGMPCFGFTETTAAEAFRAHGADPFDAMSHLPARLGL